MTGIVDYLHTESLNFMRLPESLPPARPRSHSYARSVGVVSATIADDKAEMRVMPVPGNDHQPSLPRHHAGFIAQFIAQELLATGRTLSNPAAAEDYYRQANENMRPRPILAKISA